MSCINFESDIPDSEESSITFSWGKCVERNVKSITTSYYFEADIMMYLIIEQLNKWHLLPPCIMLS